MTIELGPEARYLLDFDTHECPHFTADVLVIGGGVAGWSAALAAARDRDVLVVMKDGAGASNTAWAQGGIAAAVGARDSAAEHAADTLRTGCGLCDPAVVELVAAAAPTAVDRLAELGAAFDRDAGGVRLGREGGHGHRRILHTHGDATGAETHRALFAAVGGTPSVRVWSGVFVVDLLTVDGRCVGALARRGTGETCVLLAPSVVLAAGGAGRLFRETTNVRGATGDGIAAAFRAGAELADLEFVQFHPTTLYLAGTDRVLVTEAVRGEGAHLVDDRGRRFLQDVHPDAELAPRDVVSRAIVAHLARDDVADVALDLTHWPRGRVVERFPGLAAVCRRYGLDPARDRIPVRPAAHYFIGGVATEPDGKSTLPGLWACGEAACSGLHGANRLASNSLLEGLVLGARAGEGAAAAAGRAERFDGRIRHRTDRRGDAAGDPDVEDLRRSLTSRMWRSVGVMRDGDGLAAARDALRRWRHFSDALNLDGRDGFEVRNLLLLAELVASAALRREESRGTHDRRDHPAPDDARFRGHLVWRANESARFRPLEASIRG